MRKTEKNALINRIHVRAWLAAVALGCFSLASHAGYAQAIPPSGWSVVQNVGPVFKPAANESVVSGLARSSASINVAGRVVVMPASMRFAANAGRFAAAGVHPLILGGLLLAPPLINWMASGGFKVEGGQILKRANPDACSVGPCYGYSITPTAGNTFTGNTPEAAAMAALPYMQSQYGASTSFAYIGANGMAYFNTPFGLWSYGVSSVSIPPVTAEWVPASKSEFELGLAPVPLPDNLPNIIPFGLPVEPLPSLNPDSANNPRPLFVPTGNPLPNPKYDPNAPPGAANQSFIQPGVRVVPTPTPSSPFQVDLQPVDRPVGSAEPAPEPATEASAPEGDTQKEDSPDLCKTNPDIIACAKPELDTPDGDIPESNRDVSLNEENLFGGGSCPADVYFTPHGLQQLKVWDWNNACGYIAGFVKPILIICCTFAAFMILIPGRTE